MFEPYYLYFSVKKMQRYKNGLDVYKNVETYNYYEKDKQKVDDYIHKFMVGLVKAGDKMFVDCYKSNIGANIDELGKEILKSKDEIKTMDAENSTKNYNAAQQLLYGTTEAKNDVNEKVASRNNLINLYNDPRPSAKAMIIEKLSGGLYVNYNLDELAEAILDGNVKYFEEHKEIVDKIDPKEFAELYNDVFSSNLVETALNEIEEPNVSYELYKYGISEEIDNPFIDGIVNDDQLAKMESVYNALKTIDEGAETEQEANDKKFLGERLIICHATMEAFEKNGTALRKAIGALDTNLDHEEIERRIERFIASIACADEDHMLFRPAGLNENVYNDFEEVGKYVRQLIERSDAFGARSEAYLASLDLDKIAKNAQEKYEGKLKDNQPSIYGKKVVANGEKELEDAKKIFELINNADDAKSAFNKLINDCLDGRSNLSIYCTSELEHTPENIGRVVNYITKLYTAQETEIASDIVLDEEGNPVPTPSLTDFGINNDYIRNKCDSLVDPEVGAKSMLLQFNSQLNLYNVVGEELYALNDPSRRTDDKNLLSAKAKTEGLNVAKDSDKLSDAIATYGRMKEIHSKRGTFYWLFHPVLNYRENKVISEMKNTLVSKYGFTNNELEGRVNQLANKSTDEINKACLRLTNAEAYKELVKSEVENRLDRNKIIADQLDNIEKYGTREKPIGLAPGQEVLKSKIVKKGIVVDNVEMDFSEKPFDMSFEDFLVDLAAKDAALESILKDRSISKEEKLKIREEAKIEAIQKYVDFDGYNYDKKQETAETVEEIKNLKADLENDDPVAKENLKFSDELNSINKEIRTLNAQSRVEKFNAMLDEFNEKDELKNIQDAETEEKKAEAQAIYDKNHKEREERAEARKVSEKEINTKLTELNKKAEDMIINKEVSEFKEEFTKVFNSFDDTIRSNDKTNAEKSTVEAFNKKFDLSLDEEVEDEKSKDDIAVQNEKKAVENGQKKVL